MTREEIRPKERVLIVEDDEALRRLLEEELTDSGLQVRTAGEVDSAWQILKTWLPELILSDLYLPGANGVELLERVRTHPVPPGFIMITAFGTINQAVEALKLGADDFLTKPLDLDHLMLCVIRILENRRLKEEVQHFRELLNDDNFHGIIGRSIPMQTLFATIRQLAHAAGPVLITGESGVGKELVARAIHRESGRAGGPFIAVNCAGIPTELLESEFFGHAAGAFTGANNARKGLFAEAEGGTLLLDEIAEMPLALQAKLLRILQDGRVRPLGANQERCVDVRIIAATNRNLEEEVNQGRFREDLFYRLETFVLPVPPLRDRGEDLDLLIARFLDLFRTQLRREVRGIHPSALAHLKAYPFPGNVRELRNTIERAVVFCHEKEIKLFHLPERMRRVPKSKSRAKNLSESLSPSDESMLSTLGEIEQSYIHYVLDQVGGNKRRAAALLGISRRTLYRRLGEEESS
ncbi:sigma-54 factor interaction domain-containing protein [Nitrosococcus halophilus Nc 4]|uniref:Sigma-54 factor interaction domain-containing protein n=1 Tax=Nitrosococcus halophilus (strain Nc4) TaxID=472759 RepID=D5C1Y1_NITHN|nr:sigma-54 dependent transcriptional regulator [Nitrosococcus halophilus]ADE16569.1 sigma-54 factor interaction domain-containing protein [Nitrosococcus halophilus Nc 4]